MSHPKKKTLEVIRAFKVNNVQMCKCVFAAVCGCARVLQIFSPQPLECWNATSEGMHLEASVWGFPRQKLPPTPVCDTFWAGVPALPVMCMDAVAACRA